MSTKKVLILNQEQIAKKITRIAYQLVEDNFEETSLVLVGIADRGYVFAQRLKAELERIANFDILLIQITLDKTSSTLRASTDIPVEQTTLKMVLFVDDVWFCGRTLAYEIDVFFDVSLKKMHTVVLIDRSHHKFPIFSDFSGLKLSSILN